MLRLILCLAFAFSLSGQSWEAVRSLPAGARVRVREIGGRELKGNLAAVSAESLSVASPNGAVSVERARVARVQVNRKSRRFRNTAIGAAIGLGLGIAVDATLGVYLRNEGAGGGRALMYIAPIGVFGAIGAALSPYATVYRAP